MIYNDTNRGLAELDCKIGKGGQLCADSQL